MSRTGPQQLSACCRGRQADRQSVGGVLCYSRKVTGSSSVSCRGQQFAQQMQQQNPELVQQLRSQIRNRSPSRGNEEQP